MILYGIVYLIKSSNFTKSSLDRLVFLTHRFGGIHLFSDNLLVFFFCFLILLAVFGDNEEKNFLYNSYVSLMWVSTIIFSAILLTANLVLIGQPRYAFWKSFYLMIIMLIIYGLASFILVVLKYLFKRFKMFDLSVFFVILLIIVIFFYIKNSAVSYLWFTNGDSNFFNNKSHKYNTIIYVLERLNNYDFYIYIDQDYESSQWATRLMNGEINVINQNKPSGFNAADEDNIYIYENILNRLIKEKKKVLIIDPKRLLEVTCRSKKIVRWYIEKS